MNKGFTKSKKYMGPKVGQNAITMLAGFRTKRSKGFMKEENERLRTRIATLQKALVTACEAGLKLGEQCKLNPTAYVNDIKRAQAALAGKGEK